MSVLFILFYIFQLFFNSDDPRDKDAMLEEISSHQDVVAINEFSRVSDWKNIFVLDISLKNDVRMYIADCKRDKNGELVYDSIFYINDWKPVEIVHYTNSVKYGFNHMDDRLKEFLGNDSLIYLLDNYKRVYDFYMSVPKVDCINYENLKVTFDNIPTEFVYNVYDEETGKVIGVGKLFREKDE